MRVPCIRDGKGLLEELVLRGSFLAEIAQFAGYRVELLAPRQGHAFLESLEEFFELLIIQSNNELNLFLDSGIK